LVKRSKRSLRKKVRQTVNKRTLSNGKRGKKPWACRMLWESKKEMPKGVLGTVIGSSDRIEGGGELVGGITRRYTYVARKWSITDRPSANTAVYGRLGNCDVQNFVRKGGEKHDSLNKKKRGIEYGGKRSGDQG